MEHAPTVFRFWRDLILSDPPDLSGWLGVHHVPPAPSFPDEHHMEKMCMVVWCYTGDLDKAEEVFRPIRAVAPAAIDLHLRHLADRPTFHSTMHLYPINGAAHPVGRNDASWSYRDANFAQVIVGVSPDPADNERTIRWSKDYWNALVPTLPAARTST